MLPRSGLPASFPGRVPCPLKSEELELRAGPNRALDNRPGIPTSTTTSLPGIGPLLDELPGIRRRHGKRFFPFRRRVLQSPAVTHTSVPHGPPEHLLVPVPTVDDISPPVGNPMVGRRFVTGGGVWVGGDQELPGTRSVPLGLATECERLEGLGFPRE